MSETAVLVLTVGAGFAVGLLTRLTSEDWDFISGAAMMVFLFSGSLATALEEELHPHASDSSGILLTLETLWEFGLGYGAVMVRHSAIEIAGFMVGWTLAWTGQRLFRAISAD